MINNLDFDIAFLDLFGYWFLEFGYCAFGVSIPYFFFRKVIPSMGKSPRSIYPLYLP